MTQTLLPRGRAPTEPEWLAIEARRPGPPWVFAVTTTGVYCRSDCPARRPRRDHVTIYGSGAEAKADGYRACRRCRPDGPGPAELVARAADRLRARAAQPEAVAETARGLGLSVPRLDRLFRTHLGVTMHEFQAANRRTRAQASLRNGTSVRSAQAAAGHRSTSRLYAGPTRLGMTPATYRDGGTHATLHYAFATSRLGHVLAAATDQGVCAVRLGDDPDKVLQEVRAEFPNAELRRAGLHLDKDLAEIVRRIDGRPARHDVVLDLRTTAFRLRVWNELQRIPRGETRTYTEIARAIGSPAGVRAVASACAANPVALLIPCHRVIGADGKLTGYRWGLARKQALLEAEKNAEPADG